MTQQIRRYATFTDAVQFLKTANPNKVHVGQDGNGDVYLFKGKTIRKADRANAREEVGSAIYALLQKEGLKSGKHLHLLEKETLKVALRYLPSTGNAPSENTITVAEASGQKRVDDLSYSSKHFFGLAKKKLGAEFNVPKTEYNHINRQERSVDRLVTVNGASSSSKLKISGWLMNKESINQVISDLYTATDTEKPTATIGRRIVSDRYDQKQEELPTRFSRFVHIKAPEGNTGRVTHFNVGQDWRDPIQTAEQKKRGVASYTLYDKKGASPATKTDTTQEFSASQLSSDPDNLIVELSNGDKLVYAKAAVQTTIHEIDPRPSGFFAGLIWDHKHRRTAPRIVAQSDNLVPGEEKWHRGLFNKNNKQVGLWVTTNSPYQFADNPKAVAKKVAFEEETVDNDPLAIGDFTKNLSSDPAVLESQLSTIWYKGTKEIFGLDDRVVVTLIREGFSPEAVKSVFNFLHQDQFSSIAQQDVALRKFERNVEEFYNFNLLVAKTFNLKHFWHAQENPVDAETVRSFSQHQLVSKLYRDMALHANHTKVLNAINVKAFDDRLRAATTVSQFQAVRDEIVKTLCEVQGIALDLNNASDYEKTRTQYNKISPSNERSAHFESIDEDDDSLQTKRLRLIANAFKQYEAKEVAIAQDAVRANDLVASLEALVEKSYFGAPVASDYAIPNALLTVRRPILTVTATKPRSPSIADLVTSFEATLRRNSVGEATANETASPSRASRKSHSPKLELARPLSVIEEEGDNLPHAKPVMIPQTVVAKVDFPQPAYVTPIGLPPAPPPPPPVLPSATPAKELPAVETVPAGVVRAKANRFDAPKPTGTDALFEQIRAGNFQLRKVEATIAHATPEETLKGAKPAIAPKPNTRAATIAPQRGAQVSLMDELRGKLTNRRNQTVERNHVPGKGFVTVADDNEVDADWDNF